jgi:hypothetical protein
MRNALQLEREARRALRRVQPARTVPLATVVACVVVLLSVSILAGFMVREWLR